MCHVIRLTQDGSRIEPELSAERCCEFPHRVLRVPCSVEDQDHSLHLALGGEPRAEDAALPQDLDRALADTEPLVPRCLLDDIKVVKSQLLAPADIPNRVNG